MPTKPSFESPSGAAKVLLVDDDNAIRFSLGKILEHHGFNVSSASNVSDALRLISSDSFDVLLSDLHMPGPGDGLTVVSAMRHSSGLATESSNGKLCRCCRRSMISIDIVAHDAMPNRKKVEGCD